MAGRPNSDYKLALTPHSKAVALAPTNELAHRALGAALYRSEQFPEAIQELEHANKLRPHEAEENWRILPVNDLFLCMALHKNRDLQAERAILLRLWTRWWGDEREESKIFDELNTLVFGPKSSVARPIVLTQVRGDAELPGLELARHPALDGEAPTSALKMLHIARSALTIQKARERLGLRDLVVHEIEQDKSLPDEWRAAALIVDRPGVEKADALNSLSWGVVSSPKMSAAEYGLALAQAEAAYKLSTDDDIRNTYGVALFRAGRFEAARDILVESEIKSPEGVASMSDLPFLTMTFQKLGQAAEAKKRFNQMVDVLLKQKHPSAEMLGFLHEAEQVLQMKAPAQLSSTAAANSPE